MLQTSSINKNIQWKFSNQTQTKLPQSKRNLFWLFQYVGKSEQPVNLRINMHRHEVKSPNGGQFDKHFNLPGHDYNENARFILIEQVNQQSKMKKTIWQLLEDHKDHWMMKLKTVTPDGLNDHLNSNLNTQICS